MTIATCPHLKAYLLPQNGIQCKLCSAHRAMSAQEFKVPMAKCFTQDSPISRLPVELLIEIFHYYLGMGSSTRGDRKPRVSAFPHTDATPILLTHICGIWRYIVQRTPTLWSSLAIYSALYKHVDLVRLWLDCAGTCPLSISIDHGSDEHPERCSAENALFIMLIDRCHSWKSIDFRLDYFQQALMDIPVNALKTLARASLTLYSWPTIHHDKLWETIYSSPELISIGWACPFGQYPVRTPWAQLKVLECMNSVPISQLLHSLQDCQNLEVLIMRSGASEIDTIEPPAPPVELFRLERLEIGQFDDSFALIFDTLVTPHLTCLNLDYKHSRASDIFPLHDFAVRSGFKLQLFELDNYHLEPEDLLAWLEAPFLSMVTDLRILNKCSRLGNIDLFDPPFPKIHPTYMDSVIANLRTFVSRARSC